MWNEGNVNINPPDSQSDGGFFVFENILWECYNSRKRNDIIYEI